MAKKPEGFLIGYAVCGLILIVVGFCALICGGVVSSTASKQMTDGSDQNALKNAINALAGLIIAGGLVTMIVGAISVAGAFTATSTKGCWPSATIIILAVIGLILVIVANVYPAIVATVFATVRDTCYHCKSDDDSTCASEALSSDKCSSWDSTGCCYYNKNFDTLASATAASTAFLAIATIALFATSVVGCVGCCGEDRCHATQMVVVAGQPMPQPGVPVGQPVGQY